MFTWSFKPAVEFTTVDERTITFVMPAEKVMVSAVKRARAYPITAEGAAASKAEASAGTKVTVTAVLPEGAAVSDYDFAWSSVPEVEFAGEGASVSFTMPAEAVEVTCWLIPKTYAVTATGATADKAEAARGETVTCTAVLPEGALPSDCKYTWSSVPAVQFAKGEGTASFEMPAEAVAVTCVATLKTYVVRAIGATADKATAARGEVVTFTAVLPEGALAGDYECEWSSVPELEFTKGEGTASFIMPDKLLKVTCTATLKKPTEI